MHFRSIADLNRDTLQQLHRIPHDVDVIVGIPRSGLLPATLLSLYFNLPLADLDGFVAGRFLASGRTKHHAGLERRQDELRHVLLVDDSILSGTSLRAARQRLAAALPGKKVTTLCVYGADSSGSGADIVLAVVPRPRVFQWNVMHHQILESACVDIDGILCVDPTVAENDDGPNYLRFLGASSPLYRPTRRIHALVTSRLERYRTETEAWLAQSGIEYDHLVMLDLPDAQTRRETKAHGAFKGEYYRSSAAKLFIESESSQAREIAVLSKKPVLWLPGAEMVYHTGAPPSDPLYALRRRSDRTIKRIARSLVGERTLSRLKDMIRPAT
jgi:hypoxanthine phosphoribosyltransferase